MLRVHGTSSLNKVFPYYVEINKYQLCVFLGIILYYVFKYFAVFIIIGFKMQIIEEVWASE
jgi:hypothetical protein